MFVVDREIKLTKEQALEEHQRMWNYVADRYKEGSLKDIGELKDQYIKETFGKKSFVKNNCFCCDYDSCITNDYECESCPVKWGTEEKKENHYCFFEGSAYLEIVNLTTKQKFERKKAEKLARKIAELPER